MNIRVLNRGALKRIGESVNVFRVSEPAIESLTSVYKNFLSGLTEYIVQSMNTHNRATIKYKDVIFALKKLELFEYIAFLEDGENVWDNLPHVLPFQKFKKYLLSLLRQDLHKEKPRAGTVGVQTLYLVLQKKLQTVVRGGKLIAVLGEKKNSY